MPPRILLLLFASLYTTSGLADSNWPKFRGPEGNGIANSGTKLPTEWSATKNISWRSELPGEGWSAPVVDTGHIYVTAAIPMESSDDQFHLSLLDIDAESGDLLKTIHVMDQTSERREKIHKKNSRASPTAIVAGDRIYVHFGYQGTACLSKNGKKLWENRELYFNPTHGNGGTPILVNDRLIFTCDGGDEPKVVGLDADTGKLVWQSVRPLKTKKTFAFCTPPLINVNGQDQVIAPGADCV
jgi:outer membrane protein assembly factor BamB